MRCEHVTRREMLSALAAAVAAPTMAWAHQDRHMRRQGVPGPNGPLSLDLGVCTGTKNHALALESGADYIETGVRHLLVPDKPDEEFQRRWTEARKTPIAVRAANGFLPGSLKCTGPEADHAAVLAYSAVAFERARKVGIEHIVFGSSGARNIPDGFDRDQAALQFAALISRMGELAGKHEVTVAIEPLRRQECNFINTVAQGATFIRAAQHPNMRLLADLYHMSSMGEPATNITEAGDLLVHTHVAELEGRSAPGTHGEDFTAQLTALGRIGFTGKMSCECRWKDMPKQLPVALETLRTQIGKVNSTFGARKRSGK
jgi:sugar phosphate isomerase/epimerase